MVCMTGDSSCWLDTDNGSVHQVMERFALTCIQGTTFFIRALSSAVCMMMNKVRSGKREFQCGARGVQFIPSP